MALKIYTVNGPEGPIQVQGPEGASDEEVKAQAKRLYAAQQEAKVKALPKAEVAPVSVAQASSAPAKISDAPQGVMSTIWNASKNAALGKSPEALKNILDYFTKNSLNDKLADASGVVRDAASGVTGAAAGIASAPLGPFAPVIASSTMAVMDQALRASTGQGTGEEDAILPTSSPVVAAVKNAAINEVGGRITGVVGKGVMKALGRDIPIKGMTDELENLKPTYGQVTGHDLVENLFAKGQKQASVTASTQAADTRMQEIVGELSGRNARGKLSTVVSKAGPSNARLAEVMQAEVKQGFKNSVEASNAEASNFLSIAEQNPTNIPQPPQIVNTGLVDANGQAITHMVPQPDRVISGAIHLHNTLDEAASIAYEMNHSAVPPDPENPVLRAIDGLFNATGTVIDETTGKVISHEPISAGDAWKTKQALDKLAYGDPVEGLNVTDSKFKDLSKAVNSDIDNAVPKWETQGTEAHQSWQDAKAIVQKRHEIFSPLGESGAGTKTLLNTVNSPNSAVDSILDDSRKLQRYLETGKMVVNDRTITSSNAKRDMQGYAINRIWDKGFTPTNPLDHTVGTANGAKMATDWIEFANSDQGKALFSKTQIQHYNDFFDAVRKTTMSPGQATRWITLNFGTRAVSLGSAVLAGGLTAGSIGSAGVVGGAVSLAVVARAMANKKAAPILLAMMHGRPLGMSFAAASRILMQSMSGGSMSMQKSDGSTIEGTIATDGSFAPAKNSIDANEAAYRKSIGK